MFENWLRIIFKWIFYLWYKSICRFPFLRYLLSFSSFSKIPLRINHNIGIWVLFAFGNPWLNPLQDSVIVRMKGFAFKADCKRFYAENVFIDNDRNNKSVARKIQRIALRYQEIKTTVRISVHASSKRCSKLRPIASEL